MPGFGAVPLGSSQMGFGTVAVATVVQTGFAPYATVSPQLDPRTKQIIRDADGNVVLADGTEQRVLICLSTEKGSSVIRQFGHELRKITRITDNHAKRVDTALRAAVADMVARGDIEVLGTVVERVGQTGTVARLRWRKAGEQQERSTTLR